MKAPALPPTGWLVSAIPELRVRRPGASAGAVAVLEVLAVPPGGCADGAVFDNADGLVAEPIVEIGG